MIINIKKLTEFGLVKLVSSLPFPVICLEIDGGPCYLVAPKLKKLKETKQKHSYPCFKVATVDL